MQYQLHNTTNKLQIAPPVKYGTSMTFRIIILQPGKENLEARFIPIRVIKRTEEPSSLGSYL
jgi:hypothetical protein